MSERILHQGQPDEGGRSEIAARGLTCQCVCGEPATTIVEVQWADARRRYRYCDACATDVVFCIQGAEVVP